MRHVGFIALAFVVVACGPDPNARLPGSPSPASNGGALSAGGSGEGGGGAGGTTVSNGGTTTAPSASGGAAGSSPFDTGGSGGIKPASGGAAGSSPVGNGGVGAGGTVSAGGKGSGGITSGGGSGGVSAGGGATVSQGGSGGTTTPTSVAGGFTFPVGDEPCTPTMKDASGGHGEQLGAGAACFRTADEISDWSCSGADDRTVKVNGAAVTKCGAAVKKAGSFFYFEFSAGANAWATVSWWCSNCSGTGARAVPTCGHYPPWESGATAAPCADSGTTPAVAVPALDAGN